MNILVIDDEQSIRDSLAVILNPLPHQIFTVGNCTQGWQIIKKNQIHLIFCDYRMPEKDGLTFLRELKADPLYAEIVFIMFTGYGDIKTSVTALKSGAFDYLLKPIEFEELLFHINRAQQFIVLKDQNQILENCVNEKIEQATLDIRNEYTHLKQDYLKSVGLSDVGLFSFSLQDVYETAAKLHKQPDIPVLIEGETGVGKEVLAKYIHYLDLDNTTPFIALNCSAIVPTLFESELFGYAPGSFTGGNRLGQKGKIELAHGGTILLDEITELPLNMQAKLLRVIQEREFYPIGGLKKVLTKVRFICTTNEDIQTKVQNGLFRQDLFYRLNVGHLKITPLRERTGDILPLIKYFLGILQKERKTTFTDISSDALQILHEYAFPGNIRELKSTVERISLLSSDSIITPKHLSYLSKGVVQNSDSSLLSQENIINMLLEMHSSCDLENLNLNIVQAALKKNNNNKSLTARFLGLTRNQLYTFLEKIK